MLMRTVWKCTSLTHVSPEPEVDTLMPNLRPCAQTQYGTALERPHTLIWKCCLASGWKEPRNQKELSSFCQRDFEWISRSPLAVLCGLGSCSFPRGHSQHSWEVTGCPVASGKISKACDHGIRSEMARRTSPTPNSHPTSVVMAEEIDPSWSPPPSVNYF